ncbi:MAG: hypothetical protein Q8M17_01460 [Actinomycetota bacterium]|nr:hypothetical protein [Actinomycetota bacterium]
MSDHQYVTLPALDVRDWRGWLCKVCLRMPLESVPPWSWFGCAYCRNVDAWAARAFGGRRLLPLGQHSIMNGGSIPLSMPEGPGRRAKARGLMAIGEGWRQLSEWREMEAARLVDELRGRIGDLPDSVPVDQWQEWFPPGLPASADAFARLVKQQRPGLAEIDPRVVDVDWLARN